MEIKFSFGSRNLLYRAALLCIHHFEVLLICLVMQCYFAFLWNINISSCIAHLLTVSPTHARVCIHKIQKKKKNEKEQIFTSYSSI